MKITKKQIAFAVVAALLVAGIGTGISVHARNVHLDKVKTEKIVAHNKLVKNEEAKLLTVQTIFTESAKNTPDTGKYENVVKYKLTTNEAKKIQTKYVSIDKNIFVTSWNQQIDRNNVKASDKNFQNVDYLNNSINSIKKQLSVINNQNKDFKIYTDTQIKEFTNKVNSYVKTMQDQVNKLNAAKKAAAEKAAEKAAAAKAAEEATEKSQAEAQTEQSAQQAPSSNDSSSDATGSYSYSSNSNANSGYGAGSGNTYSASPSAGSGNTYSASPSAGSTSNYTAPSTKAPASNSGSQSSGGYSNGDKTYTDANGSQITTHNNGDGSWTTQAGGQTGTFTTH